MPTLDWLNRDEAMRIADAVPYRLLDHVGTHGASHPRVKHWVRNLERDAAGAFWLLTSHGRFFPDFICEMMDGRILVIEYKGEHLRQMQSEIGKDQVGKLWAERSDNKCLFLMVYLNENGMDVRGQLDKALR